MRGFESRPGLKSYIVVGAPAVTKSYGKARPGWRNGLRRRLKIFDPKGFVGSSPTPGTFDLYPKNRNMSPVLLMSLLVWDEKASAGEKRSFARPEHNGARHAEKIF